MFQLDRYETNNDNYAYCIGKSNKIISGWVIGKKCLIDGLLVRYQDEEQRIKINKVQHRLRSLFRGRQIYHHYEFSFTPIKNENFTLFIQLSDSLVELTKGHYLEKQLISKPTVAQTINRFIIKKEDNPFNDTSTQFELINIDNIVKKSDIPLSGEHLNYFNYLPASIQNVTPSLWLGNVSKQTHTRFNNQTSRVPPANCYEFHNVYLVGQGCIVDKNNCLFTSARLYMNDELVMKTGRINPLLVSANPHDASKFSFNKKLKIRKIDHIACVPLTQPGEAVYGHVLVDVLPRAIFAQELEKKLKYIITIYFPEWAKRFLHLLGIKDEDIIIYNPMTEALFIKYCLFPGHLRQSSAFSPLAAKLREKLIPYGSQCKNRKLFVSRGEFNKAQRITNDDALHDLISSYGIELVEPHKFSIEDQIKIFSEASFIMGEYGSAMHNSFYSYSDTNVLVLQSDFPLPFVQAGIGALLDQPTGFVFCEHIEEYNERGSARSFTAPLDVIKQVIESIIK